jgi:Family of unknown function (DUF5946)
MPSEKEQRAFHELTAWTLSLRDAGFIHQQVVDAWAAQHATEKSPPISIAFALIGLYLHLKKGFTGREVQRAHMRFAQPHGRGPGRKEWPRFKFPKERGRITAIDVMATTETERAETIDRWCQSVWEAWKDSHASIAEWVSRDLLRRASW